MSVSNVSFIHGVASGDPYADSVILWTRISPSDGSAGSLDVQWQIATSADFAPGSIKGSGSFSTSAARDWTVKVEATGLNADTPYYYRFSSGNTVSAVGQTKTLPVNSDPVRLAVFSCSNFTAAQQFEAYARAAAINSANPYDAWLHLGDYIYEYGAGGYGAAEDAASSRGFLPDRELLSLDDYRQRYAHYHTDAGLQALRASAPLIAGWDDHETANDSWSGGAENHQSASEGDWIARRDAALKAYYEWVPIREPGQRQASDGASALTPLTQAYRSFNFGDVLSLHMLETRLTARDEQLAYPDAAAVQARIGAILADPTFVASYATKAGIAPPTTPAAFPAFGAALAPLVTQELVIATVQQAWGDPNRDMIGDSQLAWLQQRLASSTAAWQVLGQQTLMQSMAVPAELLLNVGNLALLDKYAASLQQLATGTPFASLSAAEQALFAEPGKIPYNLDAWDGYGVERETILQTAHALGKRLISLAGDTHNAWAGVLDTMTAGTQPAGSIAGVEFATPGVTAPGFEKYLPGADAYIRAKYPAVDGLDGLFMGYVTGLEYADLNRRGFLDLTVSKEQAVGTFQLLNGSDPLSGKSAWSSETVVSSSSFALTTGSEARPLISWQPGWQELDLTFGLAVDATGVPTLLDPAVYASVPRDGVRLADVRVEGSPGADRVVVGAGAIVETGAGSDELDNLDGQAGNLLAGGAGLDRFFLRVDADTVIGGSLQSNAAAPGFPAVLGLVDGERDTFLIEGANPSLSGSLRILDYELGIDQILLDGLVPQAPWSQTRGQLLGLNIDVNAAPQLIGAASTFTLKRGLEVTQDLAPLASDPDADSLSLVKLEGPSWITTSGTTLRAIAPNTFSVQDLTALKLKLAFSDGKALVPFELPISLFNGPPTILSLSNKIISLDENINTIGRVKVADILISDEGLGSNVISLSGADANIFEVSGAELFLKSGAHLDFESRNSYIFAVSINDLDRPSDIPVSDIFSLGVNDINEVPTALNLINKVSSLAKNTITASRIMLAKVVVADDALGFNTISLSGADVASFELDGANLFLKAGTVLGFEGKNSYTVSVASTDSSLPGSAPVAVDYSLSVTPVDTAGPRISSIALTSSTGVLNDFLNVGDTVSATIVFTEDIRISGSGSPSLSLKIGAASVKATINSQETDASPGNTLVFSYAIPAKQTDANGISIAANSITLPSGTTIGDRAGNAAVLTHALVADNPSYKVDTTVLPPVITAIGGADKTVTIAPNDNIITGKAEALATVTLRGGLAGNLVELGTSAADASGAWSYILTSDNIATLGQGPGKTIAAITTDRAGNSSVPSSASKFSIRALPPAPPKIISAGFISSGKADNTISSQKGDNLIIGTALAGSRIQLFSGAILLGTATTNSAGAFSYALNRANLSTIGQNIGNSITAKAIDSVGNTSDSSESFSFSVDTSGPRISTIALTSSTGALNGFLNVGDSVSATIVFTEDIRISGSGSPSLSLKIGAASVKATINSQETDASPGNTLVFSYAIPAKQTDANGISIAANSITLPSGTTIGDRAGNAAVLTHALVADNPSYKVDTTVLPPVITAIGGADKTVTIAPNDNIITGKAEALATVTLRGGLAGNLVELGTSAADASGAWSYILTSDNLASLGQGPIKTIAAITTDRAGNASTPSTAATVSVFPIISVGDLDFRLGTTKADTITSRPKQVTYGGAGNDSITGSSVVEAGFSIPSFLSGGSGNDLYVLPRNTLSIIADAGGGLDRLKAASINSKKAEFKANFFWVENRDLLISDGLTSALLIDPLGRSRPEFKIETVQLADGTFSVSESWIEPADSATYQSLSDEGILDLAPLGLQPNRLDSYIDTIYANSLMLG